MQLLQIGKFLSSILDVVATVAAAVMRNDRLGRLVPVLADGAGGNAKILDRGEIFDQVRVQTLWNFGMEDVAPDIQVRIRKAGKIDLDSRRHTDTFHQTIRAILSGAACDLQLRSDEHHANRHCVVPFFFLPHGGPEVSEWDNKLGLSEYRLLGFHR